MKKIFSIFCKTTRQSTICKFVSVPTDIMENIFRNSFDINLKMFLSVVKVTYRYFLRDIRKKTESFINIQKDIYWLNQQNSGCLVFIHFFFARQFLARVLFFAVFLYDARKKKQYFYVYWKLGNVLINSAQKKTVQFNFKFIKSIKNLISILIWIDFCNWFIFQLSSALHIPVLKKQEIIIFCGRKFTYFSFNKLKNIFIIG